MDPTEYERMFHAESQHWWYLGMQDITNAILNRFVSPVADLNILDAGCGTGAGMSTYLSRYGTVIGIDISPNALKFCRMKPYLRLAQASVSEIPFKSNYFDLVTSFDVLYERSVINDVSAMAEFIRVIRPEGFILLRLPAYNWLRGHHDVTVHTARRYTTSRVTQLLEGSGFRTLHITYANTFLFPLVVTKRLLERIWLPDPNSSDLSVEFGVFNHIFKYILSSEAPLVARTGLPFGLSVVAWGQKPKAI